MANMGMRLVRSCRYRLCPNGAQDAALSDMPGHFRDLCNAGLQQRIKAWNRQGVSLRCTDQASELKAVRDAVPELAGYCCSAGQQVLCRLEMAFGASRSPRRWRRRARQWEQSLQKQLIQPFVDSGAAFRRICRYMFG